MNTNLNLDEFITKDESTLKSKLTIPGEILLDIFNTDDLHSFINGDKKPMFQTLNKYIKLEDATSSMDNNSLIIEWDINSQYVDLQPYFIDFPDPIPKVYKIPLKILQGLLRTPEYSVIIEKTGDCTFRAKRNMIGVYGKDLTVNEIEDSMSIVCRTRVRLVKMEERNFIFILDKSTNNNSAAC